MKKIKFLSVCFVLFTAAFFTSCTTDVEPLDPNIILNPDPQNPVAGVLKVDFDGQTFVATTTQAVVNSTAIAITGLRSSNGDFIQITLAAPLNQVGTYTWDNALAANTVLGLMYSNSGSLGYISGPQNSGDFAEFPEYVDTATVTISSIDMENKTITGTFQFTGGRFSDDGALETKTFTNGSFTNISFAGDITAPSSNSLFAKIDGVDFIPATVTANQLTDLLYIIGKKETIENISIVVPINVTPGTYEMDIFGDHKAIYIKDTSSTGTFNSDEGTLTIISHDTANKKIKGTFNFIGGSFMTTLEHTITDGTFEVTYQ